MLEHVAGWRETAERADIKTFVRYGLAHDAVHQACIAAIAMLGYRVTAAPGHHAEPLEAACQAIGASQGLFERLDAIYEIRNNTYKGVLADRDPEGSLEQMRVFLDHFAAWVESNPDLVKKRTSRP